jgi:transposase
VTRHLSVRQIRELFHQKWTLGRSHREVASSLGVSPGLVGKLLSRALTARLDATAVERLADDALEALLYGSRRARRVGRPMPEWPAVDLELRRPGASLEKVHEAYLRAHPGGYHYSRFCELYREWGMRHRKAARRGYRAGERMFARHARVGPWLVDPEAGTPYRGALFLAALGASDHSFAEITRTRDEVEVIESHARAFQFFAGVPRGIVHEGAVEEGGVGRAYQGLARHYRTTMLPEEPGRWSGTGRPAAVLERWLRLHFERWPPLSLEEANARVAERVACFNRRALPLYGVSRAELFASLEQRELGRLPPEPFVYVRWLQACVDADRMVRVDDTAYAVPGGFEAKQVEVRLTATVVEVFHQGARVASHARLLPRRP